MKGFKRVTAAVLSAAVCLTAVPVYVSAVEESVSDEQELKESYGEVVIESLPDKLVYQKGEELDLSGLKVSLIYTADTTSYIYENVSPLDYPEIFVVDTSSFGVDAGKMYDIAVHCTENAVKQYSINNIYHLFAVTVEGDGTEENEEDDWFDFNFSGVKYEDVLEQLNTSGKTAVDGSSLVMCINPVIKGSKNRYSIKVVENNEIERVSALTFRVKADENNESSGLYNEGYEFDIVYFRPTVTGDSKVIFTQIDADGNIVSETAYSFYADEDMNVTETDIYGWLPDSVEEYDEFIKKNGNVSVHDNYIVYCGDCNFSTGAEVIFEQSGTGKIKELLDTACERYENGSAPSGSTSHVVKVYEADTAGEITAKWTTARSWEIEESKVSEYEKSFKINEDKSITEIFDENHGNNPSLRGDASGDGEINIKDVAVLAKYIAGLTDKIDLINADLTGNGTVDILDLCMLKSELIQEVKQAESDKK